ncbi:NAD(P)/FAD-dependent oxidoreductase [Saccharothrix deserti]|uniref:NAD(P)/FAD-dependent oxidoreductase n=1 Tax=Saccharothrix deserti TaxID=2593674 RepID=UPI00131AA7AD|nr:FAD-binding oxidoreductase [Saccharothrix deserti]
MRRTADVVVVGAGAVGAACAYFAARAGLDVQVVERGRVLGGTSSACEGNVLVSDKEVGPELDLARYSNRVWREDLGEFGGLWEFEAKGGLVVAATDSGARGLAELAGGQRAAGVVAEDVAEDDIASFEPNIRQGLRAAVHYPQDAQLQPMLMTAHLLRLTRQRGGAVATGTPVTGYLRDGDRVTGVRTPRGDVSAAHVVNAAGPWLSEVAALAGVDVPVLPRRGFVLVTEPRPKTVHHKVYAAEYVAGTQSSDTGLQTSPVVEGTPSGTILIGSSRERVGFDRTVALPVLRELAAKAVDLFPVLAGVQVLRAYLGFRPYCPDHLPVIGPDPRAPGLWHAGGHEGAGIGLSAGTGKLLAQALAGHHTDIELAPFDPARFATETT